MYKYLGISSDFLEQEHIIAKMDLLQKVERLDPYNASFTLQQRIQNSLECLPPEYRKYALALFANTIYLPRSFSKSILEHMLNILSFEHGITREQLSEECLILEQDPTGIINEFLRVNHVEGRLDKSKFQRIQQVSTFVMIAVINKLHPELCKPFNPNSANPLDQLEIDDVTKYMKRKYWIVLVDNALSGTSLYSDINRLLLLREYHGVAPQKVILLIRTLSEQARVVIEDKFMEQIKDGQLAYYYGLLLDDRFVIRDNNKKCTLFQSRDTYDKVKELCHWFSAQDFFRGDERIDDHCKKSKDNSKVAGFDEEGKLTFGFKGVGLTYVSSENCPSDSLPLLWFDKPGSYISPFPRVLSRLGDK